VRKTQDREGKIIIDGKEQSVAIIDNGEDLGPRNNIPNHDKIEIVYKKEEKPEK